MATLKHEGSAPVNRRKAGYGWLSQAISGILLVLLLGMHWVAQHYLAAGGLRTYAEVVSYLENPLVLVLEAVFLAVATYHALLGVRAVLMDLSPGDRWVRLLDACLIITGIVTLFYGINLLRLILVK
jgi:succinate dehydrogenase / fumarate reductase membrane anchor subunit